MSNNQIKKKTSKKMIFLIRVTIVCAFLLKRDSAQNRA